MPVGLRSFIIVASLASTVACSRNSDDCRRTASELNYHPSYGEEPRDESDMDTGHFRRDVTFTSRKEYTEGFFENINWGVGYFGSDESKTFSLSFLMKRKRRVEGLVGPSFKYESWRKHSTCLGPEGEPAVEIIDTLRGADGRLVMVFALSVPTTSSGVVQLPPGLLPELSMGWVEQGCAAAPINEGSPIDVTPIALTVKEGNTAPVTVKVGQIGTFSIAGSPYQLRVANGYIDPDGTCGQAAFTISPLGGPIFVD